MRYLGVYLDIVLIDETRARLNIKLKQWRHSLESRELRLSRSNTECLKCELGFSGAKGSGEEVIMAHG